MYLYSSKAHKNHWNLRIRFVNNAKSTVYKSIEEECNVVNRNMTCSPNTLVNEKGFGISPASGTQYGALNISTGLLRRSYLTLFKSFYLLWRPIFQALFWYNLTFIWVCSHHNSHCMDWLAFSLAIEVVYGTLIRLNSTNLLRQLIYSSIEHRSSWTHDLFELD